MATIKEALDLYFKANDLGEDGGLNKSWARLKIGRVYIPFPNFAARKKALMLHDMHHLVTGYTTDWKGEVSISAWEISSGCGKYYAAWIIDMGGIMVGLYVYPKSVYKAFIRGQRTKNLYDDRITKEEALQMTASELAKKLQLDLDHSAPATGKEIGNFLMWSIFSLLLYSWPTLLVIGYFLFR